MSLSRRKFIGHSSLAMASLALSDSLLAKGSPIAKKFGIQLYTIKEDMAADAKASLKQLASFGYKQLESFEGKSGIFWGMGHKGFKEYVNNLGMELVSSHCNIEQDFESKAAQAAEIGMKYLICPWIGPQKSIDDFKKWADKFNKAGEICKKNGIRFAYHNHDYSFKPIDGQLGQDVMMSNTDKSLVDFEMDLYWVVTAGLDPLEYMKKHPNRFRLVHVKDRTKAVMPSGKQESTDLGTGIIPFTTMLEKVRKAGIQYFFVEQEYFNNSTPLKSAGVNANYMKRL